MARLPPVSSTCAAFAQARGLRGGEKQGVLWVAVILPIPAAVPVPRVGRTLARPRPPLLLPGHTCGGGAAPLRAARAAAPPADASGWVPGRPGAASHRRGPRPCGWQEQLFPCWLQTAAAAALGGWGCPIPSSLSPAEHCCRRLRGLVRRSLPAGTSCPVQSRGTSFPGTAEARRAPRRQSFPRRPVPPARAPAGSKRGRPGARASRPSSVLA